MIFSRLVGLRYCLYFFGTTVSLAALYTFIDVLEKFTRYHDAPITSITKYAAIAFIPNVITLSPIGSLLGSILLLREWIIHDQFLTMAIHGISRMRIVVTIFFYGVITASSIFVLHESIGYHHARQVAQAKTVLFNQPSQHITWLRSHANTFVMGLGHAQYYVLETGNNPTIAVVKINSCTNNSATHIVNFQQETLITKSTPNFDTTKLSTLTYTSTENSFIQTCSQSAARYRQQVLSDLYFFFLKILFIPFFVAACFLLAIQHPVLRWIYAGLPYIAFGTAHACAQLLGPLNGIILLGSAILLLSAFFLCKLT